MSPLQLTCVENWLAHDMSPSAPLSISSHRPKRQKTRLEQSASQIGSTALVLDAQKTFSLTSSQVSPGRKRSLSQARPPVFIKSPNGLKEAPPTYVGELGDRLVIGVDTAFIPQHLQARKPCWSGHVVITSV
jgi:hypothetical protein